MAEKHAHYTHTHAAYIGKKRRVYTRPVAIWVSAVCYVIFWRTHIRRCCIKLYWIFARFWSALCFSWIMFCQSVAITARLVCCVSNGPIKLPSFNRSMVVHVHNMCVRYTACVMHRNNQLYFVYMFTVIAWWDGLKHANEMKYCSGSAYHNFFRSLFPFPPISLPASTVNTLFARCELCMLGSALKMTELLQKQIGKTGFYSLYGYESFILAHNCHKNHSKLGTATAWQCDSHTRH